MELQDAVCHVGEALKEERKRRRVSQAELARLSGLHQGGISRLERGSYNVKLQTLLRVLDALKIDLAFVDRDAPIE